MICQMMRGDRTFIAAGSVVFKLSISGSGNSFFGISGPLDFVFLSSGFHDQDPSYPLSMIHDKG